MNHMMCAAIEDGCLSEFGCILFALVAVILGLIAYFTPVAKIFCAIGTACCVVMALGFYFDREYSYDTIERRRG